MEFMKIDSKTKAHFLRGHAVSTAKSKLPVTKSSSTAIAAAGTIQRVAKRDRN